MPSPLKKGVRSAHLASRKVPSSPTLLRTDERFMVSGRSLLATSVANRAAASWVLPAMVILWLTACHVGFWSMGGGGALTVWVKELMTSPLPGGAPAAVAIGLGKLKYAGGKTSVPGRSGCGPWDGM